MVKPKKIVKKVEKELPPLLMSEDAFYERLKKAPVGPPPPGWSPVKAPTGYKVYSAPGYVAVAPGGHKLYSIDGVEWLDESAYYSR